MIDLQSTLERTAATPDDYDLEEHAIEELPKVFYKREEAILLVIKAGYPNERIPDFRTPQVFWINIVGNARNGVLLGGIQPIIERAMEMYPGNEVFARFVSDSRDGGTTPHTGVQSPQSTEIATRLQTAYLRRENLSIAGEDTSALDAQILKMRREQRHGPMLRSGEFLDSGRFRLVEIIGYGGFATVWKAYDRREQMLVAIKVLHGQFAQDPNRRERLFRGAHKMTEIQHPHVVRVLMPKGEDQGFFYYVMEYVASGDLHQAVSEQRINSNEALDAIRSVARALEAAHAQGLVHRDVKPQNILLREDGTAVLTDFDLVGAQDTTGGTRTGGLGTVLYAAPEQNEDASRVDHRADIYSLGMTAAFCIYGAKLPKSAMYQREIFLASLPCTPNLRSFLQKAVALQPEDRIRTMTSFRKRLAQARRRRHVSLPGLLSEPEPANEPYRHPNPDLQERTAKNTGQTTRHTGPLLRLGLGLVSILGVVGLLAIWLSN